MSRYQPLADFLEARREAEWDAGFAEIESRLGFALPKSAKRYPAWWANQRGPGHSQARGWRSVGWRTSGLDLKRKRVRFVRERPEHARAIASSNVEHQRGQLVDQAVALTGITDHEQLIREALRALIEREAARRLARLGGTMPAFRPSDRERP